MKTFYCIVLMIVSAAFFCVGVAYERRQSSPYYVVYEFIPDDNREGNFEIVIPYTSSISSKPLELKYDHIQSRVTLRVIPNESEDQGEQLEILKSEVKYLSDGKVHDLGKSGVTLQFVGQYLDQNPDEPSGFDYRYLFDHLPDVARTETPENGS